MSGSWYRVGDWMERPKAGVPGCVERWRVDDWARNCPDADGRERSRARAQTSPRDRLRSAALDIAPPRRKKPAKPRKARVERVAMTVHARDDLDREGYDSLVEVGGALFGYVDEARGELVIADVTGRVSDAAESTATLDVEFIDRMATRHAEATGLRLVGTWHSHPSGGIRSSPADEDSWSSWFRHGREEPFCGLIVSKVGITWASPTLTAYLVTAGATGEPQIRAVPVEVEVEQRGRTARQRHRSAVAAWRL